MAGGDQSKRLCPAMEAAGIKDAESQKGINFCLKCPYAECIIFGQRGDIKAAVRKDKAKRLQAEGFSPEKIAAIMEISITTARRYLAR